MNNVIKNGLLIASLKSLNYFRNLLIILDENERDGILDGDESGGGGGGGGSVRWSGLVEAALVQQPEAVGQAEESIAEAEESVAEVEEAVVLEEVVEWVGR